MGIRVDLNLLDDGAIVVEQLGVIEVAPMGQRQLHEVLLHQPRDDDPIVLGSAPPVPPGVRGERPRHREHLEPSQREPRRREQQRVGIERCSPVLSSGAVPSPKFSRRGDGLPLFELSDPQDRMQDDAL